MADESTYKDFTADETLPDLFDEDFLEEKEESEGNSSEDGEEEVKMTKSELRLLKRKSFFMNK